MKFQSKFKHFHSQKCVGKCRLEMAAILSRPQCVNHTREQSIIICFVIFFIHAVGQTESVKIFNKRL